MTQKEELELIIKLIGKYKLPLSPILEYAIQEKIEELPDVQSNNKKKEDIKPAFMTDTVVQKEGSINKIDSSYDELEIEHVYLDHRGKIIKKNITEVISQEDNTTLESRKGKAWTEEEESLIKYHFLRGKDFTSIAELIGRSEVAIKARLAKLGLIDYTYGQEDEGTPDITKRPLYLERKQAILWALKFLRLPATIRNIARTISRTTWGGTIKEDDVAKILSSMPEVDSVDGNYYLKNRF